MDTSKILDILKTVFKKDSFRPKQQEIILDIISGKDVFVLLPTGTGKSLCFQLPAVYDSIGLTIVVSPLLSLMQNQLVHLASYGIKGASFNSTLKRDERRTILNDLLSERPTIRILYVTAEMLGTGEFYDLVQKMIANGTLRRLVIDEAHCISEWGSDFRPDYGRLGRYKEAFPKLQVCAFTATATKNVKKDILAKLGLFDVSIHSGSFNRKNISYFVQYKDEIGRELAKWNGVMNASNYAHVLKAIEEQVERGNDVGIVYCHSRNECDELAGVLNQLGAKFNFPPCSAYHAGLKHEDRERIQIDWLNGGKLKIIIATVSFGMGVDNPGVRFVFHNTMPKSMESFYQESGRAGRDGKPSVSILFYSKEETSKLKFFIQKEISSFLNRTQKGGGFISNNNNSFHTKTDSFDAMMIYCRENRCKRQMICEYFGEYISPSVECAKKCDFCMNPDATSKRIVHYFSYSLPFFSRKESFSQGDSDRHSKTLLGSSSSQEPCLASESSSPVDIYTTLANTVQPYHQETRMKHKELAFTSASHLHQSTANSSHDKGTKLKLASYSTNEFCTASKKIKDDRLKDAEFLFGRPSLGQKMLKKSSTTHLILFPEQIGQCIGLDNEYRDKCLERLSTKEGGLETALQKEYSVFRESNSAVIYKAKMAKALKG